jgi:hypothetical protein
VLSLSKHLDRPCVEPVETIVPTVLHPQETTSLTLNFTAIRSTNPLVLSLSKQA